MLLEKYISLNSILLKLELNAFISFTLTNSDKVLNHSLSLILKYPLKSSRGSYELREKDDYYVFDVITPELIVSSGSGT